jgi:hypothetical protein
VHIDSYATALEKFKEELKGHVLSSPSLAPNEFQSRLRQAMVASAEKARANKVKLPDNFALGFNEFTAALPKNEIAPLLAQELAGAELLTNILIEARVDSVTAFTRRPAPSSVGGVTTPAPGKRPTSSPAGGSKVTDRNIVDFSFVAAPSAARNVLNQIASSNQQLYIIRTLHVRNEKENGPPREGSTAGTIVGGSAIDTATASTSALKFIVGNEHVETSARIEMVRLTF